MAELFLAIQNHFLGRRAFPISQLIPFFRRILSIFKELSSRGTSSSGHVYEQCINQAGQRKFRDFTAKRAHLSLHILFLPLLFRKCEMPLIYVFRKVLTYFKSVLVVSTFLRLKYLFLHNLKNKKLSEIPYLVI